MRGVRRALALPNGAAAIKNGELQMEPFLDPFRGPFFSVPGDMYTESGEKK